MIFKILVFIGLYFLIKNMLKSAFVESSNSASGHKVNKQTSPKGDVIDAEFKVIKEE